MLVSQNGNGGARRVKRRRDYTISSARDYECVPVRPCACACVRACVCVVRRRRAHSTEARHPRVVRAHTYARRREYARVSERAAGTRGWYEVREEGNGGRLGSSTWLARERAVLGSGAPRPEAEGESERERETRKRKRERVHSHFIGSEG